MNDDDTYLLGKGVGLVSGFFFIVWVIGYVEWYMNSQSDTSAKERYDDQFIAGAMRGLEIMAKIVTVLWIVVIVLMVLVVILGALV